MNYSTDKKRTARKGEIIVHICRWYTVEKSRRIINPLLPLMKKFKLFIAR
jgi:hypothetical protein